MAKVTPTDLTDLGFADSQFGAPSDFTAYLSAVIDTQASLVKDLVGDALYNLTNGADYERVRQSEIYLVSAELWRRIENFERSNAAVSNDSGGAETVSSRALRNADRAEETAWRYLSELGVDRFGALSVSYNETGPYTAVGE